MTGGLLWMVASMLVNLLHEPLKLAAVGPTSVIITWSLPMNDNDVNAACFEVSCTNGISRDQFSKTVVSVNTTMVHISGLYPDTVYNCCVTIAFLKRSLPLNFTANTCTTTKTLVQFDKADHVRVTQHYKTWNSPRCNHPIITSCSSGVYLHHCLYSMEKEPVISI